VEAENLVNREKCKDVFGVQLQYSIPGCPAIDFEIFYYCAMQTLHYSIVTVIPMEYK